MTPEQIKDLLIEWSIYSPLQQQTIKDEFTSLHGKSYDQDQWYDFLKEKLEMENYWKKAGLK